MMFPVSSRRRWKEMRKLCGIDYNSITTFLAEPTNSVTGSNLWLKERKHASQRGSSMFCPFLDCFLINEKMFYCV